MNDLIDWTKLKAEYVTTNTTYRELVEKYGVSLPTIHKHSKLDNWMEDRKKHRNRVVQKLSARVSTKEASKLARLAAAADKLSQAIDVTLDDAQQFNRFIVAETINGNTESVERIYSKKDTRAMRDLAGAVRDLTGALRSLHNIPTLAEQESMAIARERLELDKRKAMQGETNDESTGVVVIPAVDAVGDAAAACAPDAGAEGTKV